MDQSAGRKQISMFKWTGFIIFLLLIQESGFSQSKINQFLKPSDTLNVSQKNSVFISEGVVGGLTLFGLNQLWYADYDQSGFHTFNDNQEWLQMDKIGHAFTSYQMGRAGANLLSWSGAKQKEQLIYGATLGFTFLTAVEIMDGFSKEWGFSWGDMLANASGTMLYIGQELAWQDQIVLLKYSFHQTKYATVNPEKLGNGVLEQLLKDYNGQTYWMSINLKSIIKNDQIPPWLNLAFGYGGDGMVFANNEPITESESHFIPRRQFYFSLDVDLSRVHTNSNVLRSIFDVLNVIKVPFPALEFTDKNSIKLHGIYF